MSKKLSPDTPIFGLDNVSIADFWAWAYSDVLGNRVRSIFGEFLVGYALNIVNIPRIEWDAVDLRYGEYSIEVKTAGYVQSWHKEQQLSKITFDISTKLGWNSSTNTYSSSPIRAAACYVFCVHAATNHSKANPLDISQWEFYVLPTYKLEEYFGNQKSVALSRLNKIISPIVYNDLKSTIDSHLITLQNR